MSRIRPPNMEELPLFSAEIIEALRGMEVFTAFNRFLDSLQIDIDF